MEKSSNFDDSCLSRLMESVAGQTGSIVNLHDLAGITLKVPDLRIKPDQHLHHGKYCRFAKAHGHNAECGRNKEKSLHVARKTQKPFWGCCPMGIWDLAFPVVMDGRVLAVLYLGYFRTKQPMLTVRGATFKGPQPPVLLSTTKPALLKAARVLAQCILWLIQDWRRTGGSFETMHSIDFYEQATRRFIDTHFSEPVRLSDYAAQLRVHPNHLGKMVRKTFGETFVTLLRERRLEQAKLLLRTGDDSVTRIAYECGFHDGNYFSTVFARHVGMSPRQYRSRSRTNQA